MLLPPCPQHQEVISGSRTLMWPQIQGATARTGRDPCSENIVPTHWDRAGKSRELPGCIPGLSFGHQPGQCGQQRPQSMGEVWKRLWGCTAHIPQGILFCADFSGCSQRKSVTRRGQEPLLAPAEHLKGSSGTDTKPSAKGKGKKLSCFEQKNCRVLL